ncbi:DNA-binding transcriptional LysR family regulator [Silvibacterium bohemicum]|uniref:DNA-binding transcriptional LysR family regulator n=1 Tax=Silvibacterium bohemicum TaxID=1577686 RepID=A0A841K4A6_9BACT|nr:LysR family transcriptional regulator [Silvibacterium bohemicum]MBB6147397.1 DNA-binding transcriptional LysR family regulator [Silvibacterium bohemicum]
MADEVAELQLFVEIVRAGNLSAAARVLNSSPAAMSRGLAALESRLGVRLVTRTSRSFELTEEGQLFYERCARIVAEIADAEAEASSKGETIKGMLRLGAPMELGRRLVAPLITEFRQKFPDVQVHLVLSDSGLDVIDDGLDVALRVGLPSDSSVIAKKVLTAKRIVCASPDYFRKHGIPATPDDLLQHDCIRLVRGRRVMDAWVFQDQGKRFEVVVSGTLTTTSGEVVHDWVRAGKGIALKADWDLQPELREGSIVPCLGDYWCDEINLFALSANRRHLSPRIRAFLKFIVARLPQAVAASGRGSTKSHPR